MPSIACVCGFVYTSTVLICIDNPSGALNYNPSDTLDSRTLSISSDTALTVVCTALCFVYAAHIVTLYVGFLPMTTIAYE